MSYLRANLFRKMATLALVPSVLLGLDIVLARPENVFRVASAHPLSGVPWILPSSRDKLAVRSVPFCVLVNKPDLYDQRIVRTTAVLIAGYEQFFLFSPLCGGQDNLVWVENDPAQKTSTAIDKRLESVLAVKSSKHVAGRAQVVVLGRFIGPGGKRFGHLDQFRMKFVI